MAKIPRPLTARRICHHIGITYRQLNVWAGWGWFEAMGIERAPKSGHPRSWDNFTDDDIAWLRVLKRASEIRQMSVLELARLIQRNEILDRREKKAS